MKQKGKHYVSDEQISSKANFGVIKANPEQSKHLETATTKIFGQFIDLVNLRTEKYAEDAEHRIPTSMVLPLKNK